MGSFSLKRQSKCKASYFCYFVKKGPGKCRNYRWMCNSIRPVPLDRYTAAGESLGGQYRARQTNNKAFFPRVSSEYLNNNIYIFVFVLLFFFARFFRSARVIWCLLRRSFQTNLKKKHRCFWKKIWKKMEFYWLEGTVICRRSSSYRTISAEQFLV